MSTMKKNAWRDFHWDSKTSPLENIGKPWQLQQPRIMDSAGSEQAMQAKSDALVFFGATSADGRNK